jgi:hypothetical protein
MIQAFVDPEDVPRSRALASATSKALGGVSRRGEREARSR